MLRFARWCDFVIQVNKFQNTIPSVEEPREVFAVSREVVEILQEAVEASREVVDEQREPFAASREVVEGLREPVEIPFN